MAAMLEQQGAHKGDRICIIATKCVETVAALLAAFRLGAIAVPINPQLKTIQIQHILNDSGAKVLMGPADRLAGLKSSMAASRALPSRFINFDDKLSSSISVTSISKPVLNENMPALILYTSGSTAKPKGVVVSQGNLGFGAMSVSEYLKIGSSDRLLAMMPLSFDYGLNQIISALHVGAHAVLFDYLFPKGVVSAIVKHKITGVAAVPHLWNQVARLNWPDVPHLRYITNTGGRMPVETVRELEIKIPQTNIVLMYGFTEAFQRPESMGRAIPYSKVVVVNEDGALCKPGEIGELVHSGPLVTLGYWNDETASKAKFNTDGLPEETGIVPGERYAFSGDLVRRDAEGFLYFVSRKDDMIKLHGFRVNPLEIEAAIEQCKMVDEVSVVCIPHPILGQAASTARSVLNCF